MTTKQQRQPTTTMDTLVDTLSKDPLYLSNVGCFFKSPFPTFLFAILSSKQLEHFF